MRVEIDFFDYRTLSGAVADEIAKVFESHLALAAGLECLLAPGAELLNRSRQADAKIVSGEAQDLADRARDASAIGMHVVDSVELRRNLVRQAVRQRLRDLLDNPDDQRPN